MNCLYTCKSIINKVMNECSLGVYASPNEQNKRILWENMKMITAIVNKPWLVVGDFNDIAFANENKRGV